MKIKHLFLIALLATFNTAEACTNFLITKGASVDGSNFISYCADSHISYGELSFTPAADWPAGSMRICYDRGTNAPRGSVPSHRIPIKWSAISMKTKSPSVRPLLAVARNSWTRPALSITAV